MGKNRVHGPRRAAPERTQHAGPPAPVAADVAMLLQQGIGYHRQGQLAQAEALYRRILEVAPEHADALHLLGVMAHQVGRHEIALKLLDKAAELAPNSPVVHNNRGVTLKALRIHAQALESFDRAIALAPQGLDAHYNRGNTLREIKRYKEALESYEIALRLKPDYEYLDGARLFTKASIFDWDGIEEQTRRLEEQIGLGRKVADPFFVLGLSGSPVVQRQAAEIYVRDKYRGGAVWPLPARPRRERIRVGYFSPDFREHAVSYLTAEIFERHDRSQFEVVGFSFGPKTEDAMQKRIAAAMDRFVDVRAMSNAQIVQLSREMEIDIAVDLAGHTFGSRPEIFAERAAPVQINYLGHPGTMGGSFIDYLIGDEYLIPEASRAFYSEKIAYLPDCFQANDSRCAASERTFRRVDEGLPEEGFVYCCFNSSYKITPAMFDVWMRILHRVEGSVLWLLDENALVQPNLRKEAEKRGIAPERLVFAGRLPLPEHMARQGLADVFLDTVPFNAGATASSAMWAGLPILTCEGEVFASRMAATLLRAVGLAELVTADMADYEEMAVRLAQEPGLMAGLRERLREARSSAPLFDVPRFTRNLEKAYCAMVERHQAGLGPDHLFCES